MYYCGTAQPQRAYALYRLHPSLMPVQEYADESQEIPRPANWGGYLVQPRVIEFWHGRPSRLHDRLQYVLEHNKWRIQRLSP